MSAIVHLGDCLEIMRGMADNSVDLICTDPPYFQVKAEWWDRQWQNPAAFLAWLDTVFAEFQRILKPNGSLYVFASPQMAARVEVLTSERFNVLNHIVWAKPSPYRESNQGASNVGRVSKESLRGFYPNTERVIFAEHFGADNMAKGEAGYEAKCDELRGFVFEPLRAYLDRERMAAGLTFEDVNIACGFREKGGMAGRHWFNVSQFAMPTATSYKRIADLTGRFQRSHEDLRREYEDLRREYEDLRREYEDLRRPFAVTPHVPHTDVWDFPTVGAYDGKHPCEKPLSLLEHIITASSRPGAVVFDAFTGSGAIGQAAVKLGREFIGAEIDPHWQRRATRRVANAQPALLGIG